MTRGAYGLSRLLAWEQGGDDGRISRDGRPISVPNEDDVIGFWPLYDSMGKCVNGVLWKGSVANFWLNGAEFTSRLCDELHDGTYVPKPMVHFTVTCPKVREIVGIAFRDRVYQRSLNDNLIYPIMSRSWIYDNGACQKGKGTDFSRKRFKCHLERHFRKHDIGGNVLSLDVKGYYPNMRHSVAEAVFEKHLPGWGYKRVVDILHHQYPGDVGYNPGSQLIQIAGVSVLSGIDHFIKEELGVKGYVRYMDDFRLIHPDRRYLEECKYEIENELWKLGFRLNQDKTRMYYLTDNVPFLGFTYRMMGTGKIVMTPVDDTVHRMKRKLSGLSKLEAKGLRPEGVTDQSYQCYRSHFEKGDSYFLVEACDEWYENLWKVMEG